MVKRGAKVVVVVRTQRPTGFRLLGSWTRRARFSSKSCGMSGTVSSLGDYAVASGSAMG